MASKAKEILNKHLPEYGRLKFQTWTEQKVYYAMKEIACLAWDGAVEKMRQSLKITEEEGSFTIPGTPMKQQFIDNLFNNEVD